MKTIGLIGGMSWESTLEYYRILNQEVRRRLGGQHSASILLHSLDFAGIERCQREGRWDDAAATLQQTAAGLEAAGADLMMIGANTMHKVAEQVQQAIRIPLVHIADATAAAVQAAGMSRIGLLGTRFVMEEGFLKQRLARQAGLEVLVPGAKARGTVHAIIYQELCQGIIQSASRDTFKAIMQDLADAGAAGIVLGCTEIPLLVGPGDSPLPLFDTTALHAQAAVDLALA